MRRRFGRRRWGGGDEGGRSLDVARELARVAASGVVPADALEPADADEVPGALAAVGAGTSREGEPLIVATSPAGGDAWLAAVAVGARLVEEEGFAGVAYAVAPSWPLAARRRLGLLRPGGLRVRARLEAAAPGAERDVAPEAPEAPLPGPLALDAEAGARALLERAATALAGLAAKHGGSVRPGAAGLELLLLGRVVAGLRADDRGVWLEAWEPRRESMRLAPDALSDALDRLEGSLRKFLTDRRIREGEPGLRALLAGHLVQAAGVRDPRLWPNAGPAGEAIDFAGIDGAGHAVIGVARQELTLTALGSVLDGWLALAPRLPALLAEARPPARPGAPPLLLAAERVDPAALRVLACLDLELRYFAVEGLGRREPVLVPRAALARLVPGRPREAVPAAAQASFELREAIALPAAPERPPIPQREFDRPAPPVAPTTPTSDAEAEEGPRRRFEEFSFFDLAEVPSDEAGRPGGRRRRRRRRSRGRGPGAAPFEVGAGAGDGAEAPAEDDEEAEAEPEARTAPEPRSRRGRRGRGRDRDRRARAPERIAPSQLAPEQGEAAGAEGEAREPDEVEGDEALVPLAEVPEVEEAAEPVYDDEEEAEEEEESAGEARIRREREARRRARLAKTEPEPVAPPPPPAPRRRAAILAHADRDSIAAAVLLARDLRLLDGIWIYPQADLMTFFRSVATDLREDTPIYVVGFAASPARDTLQAASLYRERLVWYDHHEWPPEDLDRLRAAIGAEAVHVDPSCDSSLAIVLSGSSRRSRFSDKLVDLVTGRFTRHDYERWGRLWWWRLGQLGSRPGERRAELDALLAGRPSDLAREASRAAAPPPPPEVAWVAERDFRLVHFGGYALVRVPVPAGCDAHLAARVARERYGAQLSLAWVEGSERFVLGADDATSRRALDLGAMIEHLADKFAWVSALPDADHVSRFRIEGAAAHAERVDEVVGQIAMGRSLLEG